jgi:hypothetical protein
MPHPLTDVGMAIEVLHKALLIPLPESFSNRDMHPMKTIPSEYLPEIIEQLSKDDNKTAVQRLEKLRKESL